MRENLKHPIKLTHAVMTNKLDDSNKLAPPVTADKNALNSSSKEKTEVTESLKTR